MTRGKGKSPRNILVADVLELARELGTPARIRERLSGFALMRHCIERARGIADYLVSAESTTRVNAAVAALTDADVKAIACWAFNAVARTEPFDTDQKCLICRAAWPCADQRLHADAVVAAAHDRLKRVDAFRRAEMDRRYVEDLANDLLKRTQRGDGHGAVAAHQAIERLTAPLDLDGVQAFVPKHAGVGGAGHWASECHLHPECPKHRPTSEGGAEQRGGVVREVIDLALVERIRGA